MKDLDQPSRASLRKYGVRFGAYHIYLPALLKPAARSLASLLWAEKQSNVDMSALSGAQHLASSGRTSFPIDKALPRDAYRVLGYRQCGERAVRVDILERLADLIRPALAWRETSPGTKPAGALDGRGFVITQAMTSLTGSAGEDFASILRALGYRMERRAPPPPKPVVVEAPAAEAAPPEAVPEASAEANPEAAVEAAATKAVSAETPEVAESAAVHEVSESAPSATLLPDVAFSPAVTAEEVPAVEALPNQPAPIEEAVAVAEAPQEAAVEATSEAPAVSDAAPAETPTADALAAASPEAPAVPELIEVWRPGGRPEERRPRHDRARHRHHDRPQAGAVPAAAAAPGEPGEAPKHERHRRGRRDRNHEFRKLRPDAPVEGAPAAAVAEGAPASEPREDKGRPPRERFEGKGRDRDKDSEQGQGRDRDKGKFGSGRDKGSREHGGRDNGGRDKGGRDKGGRESGPSHRQYATSAAPRERDRPIDPNSPFAKLAALKEQLAANRKDR
jgi:ATP-dependent RNA helicase SUPV3L1/SUV3